MSEEEAEATGRTAVPRVAARADISDAEVEALLDKETGGTAAAQSRGGVTAYDLVAPDKIVRGRMPVLDRINERWNADFRRRLAELIRRPLTADIQPVRLVPFGEWQSANTGLTSFNIYAVRPWQRNAMIALDGDLLFALVDAYYGGNGAPASLSRQNLTATESRLNAILVTLFVDHFRAAFEPIAALEFVHQKTETNPHYAEIATPSETVVVNRMDIAFGDVHGAISLVLPVSMFDSVRDKLSDALKSASGDERRRWFDTLRGQLNTTEMELATVFLQTGITLRELLMLKPGDVLPVEMPKTATLYAGSRPLLSAKFGLSRGYNAVSIIGPLEGTGAAMSTGDES